MPQHALDVADEELVPPEHLVQAGEADIVVASTATIVPHVPMKRQRGAIVRERCRRHRIPHRIVMRSRLIER